MSKLRRATASRSAAKKRKVASRTTSRKPAAIAKKVAITRSPAVSKAVEPPPPPAPPAPPRKPAFYEALAIYESGVRALQRHDFDGAAASLRQVIREYPGEGVIVDRARLFLRVCERETARRPVAPKTPSEAIYAATVALNGGDTNAALTHLHSALEQAPDSDHAHYVMSLALLDRGDSAGAVAHLTRAISLNPDNRSVAIQDPDLAIFHKLEILQDSDVSSQSAARPRLKSRR